MKKKFTRVRSTKDIIISSILITGGILFATLADSDSLCILGFFMIFAGLISGLILKTAYKDEDTGFIYGKKERFFGICHKETLSDAVTSGKCKSADLSDEDKGNGLRLDIYHSNKAGKAYIQLYEYVPYKYEPCTGMQEHDIMTVAELIGK